MKSKAFAGLMATMLLVGMMLYALPVKAAFDDEIRIGIIGPVGLPHWSPAGMKEAAEMAATEINDAGGVVLADGRSYEIKIRTADENAIPVPNPDAARAETLRLITQEKVHFIIGGFRTEVTTAILETCAENKMPFFIDGSSTTELLKDTVGVDYHTYKYIFRNMPMASVPGLFGTICAWLQFLVQTKLLNIYGYNHTGVDHPQVDVAVVTEDLAWTTSMHIAFTDPTKYAAAQPGYPNGYLGKYINVTYNARIPETATDLTSWLNDIKASGARILIHEFSGRAGLPLIIQWKELDLDCLPIGINVLAQIQDHWTNTLGKCQYETVMNPAGTATAVNPGVTDVFWNNFVGNYSKWPIYTAFGMYDAIMGFVDPNNNGSLQAGGMNTVTYLADRDDGVVDVQAALDNVIDTIEDTDRSDALLGRFKFTTLDYYNPIGLWWPHDVYHTASSMNYTWDREWTRGSMIQWQLVSGQPSMEVVDPVDQTYTTKYKLLPSSYPAGYETMADTDTVAAPGNNAAIDGTIDSGDMDWVTGIFWLSKPGGTFNCNGDLDNNNIINIIDVAKVGRDWDKEVVYANGEITLP